jgi:sodium/potassium-transporting ATPase subunit beta
MPEPSKPNPNAPFSGFKKPVERSGWEGFKHFIWDSENSAFLGRTASSWGKIILFYLIYYAILAGVWAFMLWVFLQTMSESEPKWQQGESIIGVNPGVAFRPAPPLSNIDSTLVHFSEGKDGNSKHWVSELNALVDEMVKEEKDGKYVDCHNMDTPKKPDEVCRINIADFGSHCTKENSFGYTEGKPCIFIKLNKIYGWEPPVYERLEDLPEEMPAYLRETIEKKYTNETSKQITKKMVWLSCQGENAADKENIGELEITPDPGIPAVYFPFLRQKGFKSPMVAIKFMRPEPAVLINIECKTWFKGVVHNRRDRVGSVHFELLMD